MTTFSQRFLLSCLDQHTLLSDLVVLTRDSSTSHYRPHINENQMKGSRLELTLNFNLRRTIGTIEWNCLWNSRFAGLCGKSY